MKSILIIGAGNFGHYLCRNFLKLKNQVMIIDKEETALDDLLDDATGTLIADCTRESVLSRIGVDEFDLCFVCISGNFQTALEITSLLKDMGAKYVVSLAGNEVHSKFLLRNGADEVIHPNLDSAIRAAVKYNSDHVFNFVDLRDGYAIYEISPLPSWVGKSLQDAKIHSTFEFYVIGVTHAGQELKVIPSPEETILEDDRLMVLAHEQQMNNFIEKTLK